MDYVRIGVLILVFLSGCLISYFDLKYKAVPLFLLIINFGSVCYLINNILLLIGGLFILIYAYYKELPIDFLYIALIIYLIIIGGMSIPHILVSMLFTLLFVMTSKQKDEISFMFPLEIILVTALL
jgi:hypothetical protein